MRSMPVDWRMTRALTLNAGLRYDYDGPITERFDRSVRGFDFAASSPIAAQAKANYARTPCRNFRRAVSGNEALPLPV